METFTNSETAMRLRRKRRVRRCSLRAASGLFVVPVALGLMSACGADHGLPVSPTPLGALPRLSAGATASSPLSVALVAVSPPSGPASGGTPITITGDDFAQGAIVLLDGLAVLNVVVLTNTLITAVTALQGMIVVIPVTVAGTAR